MPGRVRATEQQAVEQLVVQVARAGGRSHFALDDVLAQAKIRRWDRHAQARLQRAVDAAGLQIDPALDVAQRGAMLVVTMRAAADAPPAADAKERPSRRQFVFGWPRPRWVVGFVVGAVILVPLGTRVRSDAEAVVWHARHLTLSSPSSCQDTGYLDKRPQRANAYYVAEGHSPHDTDDGNRDTAWVGKFKSSDNDWISWRLGENGQHHAYGVKLICLMNGWAQNYKTYNGAGRVRRISVIGYRGNRAVKDKGCRRTQTLPSTAPNEFGEYVALKFDCRADQVSVKIRSIYPPRSTRVFTSSRNAAISDAQFWG